MRHYRYIVFALLVFSTAAQAQWLRVWQGGFLSSQDNV
mgnify:CR=1 FL=1